MLAFPVYIWVSNKALDLLKLVMKMEALFGGMYESLGYLYLQ